MTRAGMEEAPQPDRLAALNAAAAAAQWDPAAVDWSERIAVPWYLPRTVYVDIVSQLFHGERAARDLCRRLAGTLDDAQAETFLAWQIADETRHCEVYRRYLARLGDIRPHHPALDVTREAALAWRGSPLALVVATHILLEGEAVQLQHELAKAFACPLFRDITTRAARDEARHHAFGRVYLRDRLAALDPEERLAMYRWVRDMWQDCALATRSRFFGLDSFLLSRRRDTVEARWRRHAANLREIGLVHAAEATEFERAAA